MAAQLLSIAGDKVPEVVMERRCCEECGGSAWIWRTAMDDVSRHHLVCMACDIGPIALTGLAECDAGDDG